MQASIQKLKTFLLHDMWQINLEEISRSKFIMITILKKLYLTISHFFTKGTIDYAAALTYSTMLAIVPIFAVVFAVARGFGFSKYIEDWFRNTLSGQAQAADIIIKFVNSYLIHTHSGVILGVGLLFMLWTVLNLTRKIEQTFNTIWQIKKERTLFRSFTDYLAMVFTMPIMIVLLSGISIFMTTFINNASSYMLLAPMLQIVLKLMPFIIVSCMFIGLYIFMPNTKVRFSAAFIPGIISGVAMQFLQLFYIHGQMLLSSYNAIYGTFAALPLFMLWLQVSWTICLFGAQLCYTNQNIEFISVTTNPQKISHRYRLLMSAILLSKICNRLQEGKKPYTALALKNETQIPIRIINYLLSDLARIHLINSSWIDNGTNKEIIFQPAEMLERITVGTLVDRLEAFGKWNVDIDLKPYIKTKQWKHIFALRKQYLNELRNVPICNLIVKEDK